LENEVASGEVPIEQVQKGPTKKALTTAIERVAADLGNTPAVCRKCYIHPAIIDSYMDGTLAESLTKRVTRRLQNKSGSLRDEERLVLSVLRRRLASDTRSAARASAAEAAMTAAVSTTGGAQAA